MTPRGTARVFFDGRREKRLGVALSRRLCARMSSTLPSWSTVRHKCFSPLLVLVRTSSRCDLSSVGGR
ncbi:hypothetical protein AMK33_36630 [Streptomyces sp. CB02400]|nr:hypothetical protein AMK33_36630 [Streptomyces sp. CB02400]